MKLEDILYEKEGPLAVATFNRPNRLNAFRTRTFDDFEAILDDAAADDELRVLILTGTGRAFSAGVDLKELAEGDPVGDEVPSRHGLRNLREGLLRYQALTRRMVHHPKTIIAAINGVAVGVGAEVSLASDLRIAADTARLAFTEVKRGLFETNGVLYLLPRIVGHGRALEMLLTGDMVSAQEMLEAGLVTRMVAADRLLTEARELAGTIAANAPITVRRIREIMARSWDLDLEAVMQLEVDGNLEVMASDDLREGVASFVEGREPRYRGR
jgi:enoyl-CoA hydratase/carnithine racemase